MDALVPWVHDTALAQDALGFSCILHLLATLWAPSLFYMALLSSSSPPPKPWSLIPISLTHLHVTSTRTSILSTPIFPSSPTLTTPTPLLGSPTPQWTLVLLGNHGHLKDRCFHICAPTTVH